MGIVLVVDDDASLQRILTTALAVHGVVVRSATNSKSALDVIASERPDDVLVDLSLNDTLGIDRSGLGVLGNILLWDPTLHAALFTSFLTKKVEDDVRAMRTVDILEKPATIPQILAWIAEKNTQLEGSSGRWGDVSPRRVLYLFASTVLSRPFGVSVKVVTTIEDTHRQLRNDHEIVLIDGDHDHLVLFTTIAAEQGLCVFALTGSEEIARRAKGAGAVGAISPNDVDALATVSLASAMTRVPVAPWACAEVEELIVRAMPHRDKLESIDRVLLEDARIRHTSVRTSAVAAGLSRSTMTRHLTPKETKAHAPQTEVSSWVCARVQQIITTPMRHKKKIESIGRLLVQDALVRHKTVAAAAVALGISRWTLMRHLTPQAPTSSDAESPECSKNGHGSIS